MFLMSQHTARAQGHQCIHLPLCRSVQLPSSALRRPVRSPVPVLPPVYARAGLCKFKGSQSAMVYIKALCLFIPCLILVVTIVFIVQAPSEEVEVEDQGLIKLH